MHRIAAIAHLVLTATLTWSGPATTTEIPAPAAEVTAPAVEVAAPAAEVAPFGIHGPAATHAVVEEAMELFESAGLTLPPLRIFVHATHEPCNGNLGLYSKGGDLHRIDLCDLTPWLIVHELAHAWERHNVDDETRDAFMAHTGAGTWNDHAQPHPARGVEQAADAIAWGLIGHDLQPQSAGHHAEDLAHFEHLTGTVSPRLVEATSVTLDVDPATIGGDVEANFG